MRTRWEKPKYDKRPDMRETLPEMILRKWPADRKEMHDLLHGMTISYGDVADLKRHIERTNDRCVELVQRHGVPAHIMRTREEYGVLLMAQDVLAKMGIA